MTLKADDQGFTRKQIAEITGLSERSVLYYTERCLIVPEIDGGSGRGKSRRYSRLNLLDYLLIKGLHDFHISIKLVGEIVESFRQMMMTMGSLPHGYAEHVAVTIDTNGKHHLTNWGYKELIKNIGSIFIINFAFLYKKAMSMSFCPDCHKLFCNTTRRKKIYCSSACQKTASVKRVYAKKKRGKSNV